jgi:hypothetical protein
LIGTVCRSVLIEAARAVASSDKLEREEQQRYGNNSEQDEDNIFSLRFGIRRLLEAHLKPTDFR